MAGDSGRRGRRKQPSVSAVRDRRSGAVRRSVGDDSYVAMTTDDFVSCLLEVGPSVRQIVEEHHRDQGELLLHVLCGDLSRYCVEAWNRGGSTEMNDCLACASRALDEGDQAVRNAIEASFVENVGPWDDHMRPFIAIWPVSLRAEAERQAHSR